MSRKGKKPNKKKQQNHGYQVKNERQSFIYTITFFVGIIFGFFDVILFDLTIIPAYIPLLLVLIPGLIAAKIDWNRYGKTFYSEGINKILGCYLVNLLWWGSMVCFLFLALNFYGSTSVKKVEELTIIKWSSQKGGKGHREKRSPIFTVKYKNFKKKFVFKHKYYTDRLTYKTIVLTTQKGFLGYTIIKDKELSK